MKLTQSQREVLDVVLSWVVGLIVGMAAGLLIAQPTWRQP
jgi:hypothetical protein